MYGHRRSAHGYPAVETPPQGVQERKDAPTFREVVAEWQRDYAETNRTERVRKDDQSVLNLYILPAIGDMKSTASAGAS